VPPPEPLLVRVALLREYTVFTLSLEARSTQTVEIFTGMVMPTTAVKTSGRWRAAW
jgi:hypothetical protein